MPMSARIGACFDEEDAGFNCDTFVFARHEGREIAAGWHFYVLPESTVTSAVGISPIFDLWRVTSLGAVRCDPGDLRSRIIEAVVNEPEPKES